MFSLCASTKPSIGSFLSRIFFKHCTMYNWVKFTSHVPDHSEIYAQNNSLIQKIPPVYVHENETQRGQEVSMGHTTGNGRAGIETPSTLLQGPPSNYQTMLAGQREWSPSVERGHGSLSWEVAKGVMHRGEVSGNPEFWWMVYTP